MLLKKKRFWGIVIAILLLAYCVKDIRTSDLRELADRVDYWQLFLSIISSFIFVVCRAIRWRDMIHQYSRIPIWRSITLFSTGQLLNVTMPALTGQVGRVFLFSRQAGLRKSHIVSTIVLEVVFDALSMVFFLLLTSLVFVFPDEYRAVSFFVFGGTILILALLYAVIFSKKQVERWLYKHIRSRWPGVYVSVTRFFRSFSRGLGLLKSSQHVAISLFVSLVAWTGHAASIYFLFVAFGFHLPFPAAAAVMIIATIALMVPITPGNAGTYELAVSSSLLAMSIDKPIAVLFALTLHIVDVLPAVVLGSLFLVGKRTKEVVTALKDSDGNISNPQQPHVVNHEGKR